MTDARQMNMHRISIYMGLISYQNIEYSEKRDKKYKRKQPFLAMYKANDLKQYNWLPITALCTPYLALGAAHQLIQELFMDRTLTWNVG